MDVSQIFFLTLRGLFSFPSATTPSSLFPNFKKMENSLQQTVENEIASIKEKICFLIERVR